MGLDTHLNAINLGNTLVSELNIELFPVTLHKDETNKTTGTKHLSKRIMQKPETIFPKLDHGYISKVRPKQFKFILTVNLAHQSQWVGLM